GALSAYGTPSSPGSFSIDHATVSDNAAAGLYAYTGGRAFISQTTSIRNGAGVSANGGYVMITDHSHLNSNLNDGLYFNLTNSYTDLASSITQSDVISNSGNGVYI